jgi:hypothetical protein
MMNKLNLNKKFEKQFLLKQYYWRFKDINQTTFLYTWPSFKMKDHMTNTEKTKKDTPLDSTSLSNAFIVDELRRVLFKHNFYIEALNTRYLRKLNIKFYGPVIAVSSKRDILNFDKELQLLNTSNIEISPLAFFKNGYIFTEYQKFLTIHEQFSSKVSDFDKVHVKLPLDTIIFLNTIRFTIIQNILKLCL